MTDQKPQKTFDSSYEESGALEGMMESLGRKPLGYLAVAGILGSCGYAFYKYKTKGVSVSPSLFLIQLRVAAQGTAVGILTLGALYESFYQQNIAKKKEKK